jgi:hypothetical protein
MLGSGGRAIAQWVLLRGTRTIDGGIEAWPVLGFRLTPATKGRVPGLPTTAELNKLKVVTLPLITTIAATIAATGTAF